jgi:hypothetical protein
VVKTAQRSRVSPANTFLLRCRAPMHRQRDQWDKSTSVQWLRTAQVDDGVAAGLVVAVRERGKVTFERGYGLANVEWNVPVTTDTVFRVGSITKQFAAAGFRGRQGRREVWPGIAPAGAAGPSSSITTVVSRLRGQHDLCRRFANDRRRVGEHARGSESVGGGRVGDIVVAAEGLRRTPLTRDVRTR